MLCASNIHYANMLIRHLALIATGLTLLAACMHARRLSSDTWDSGGGGGGGGGGHGGVSLLARSGSSCYAGGATCSKERLLRLAALRSGAPQHPPSTPSPLPRRTTCSSALRRSSSEYSTNSVIANTPNSALFSSPSTNGSDWSTPHRHPPSMQQNRQAAMAAAAAVAAVRYGRASFESRTSYKYSGTTANASAALGYYVPVLTQLDEVVEPGCEEEGAEGGGWQGAYGGGGYDRSSIPQYPDGGVGGEPDLAEGEGERGSRNSRNSDMTSPFVAPVWDGTCR